MDGPLRPLRVGEILDAGFKVFLAHWRTLVLSVVGLILPVQIVSALVTAAIAPEQLDWTTAATTPGEGDAAELAAQAATQFLALVSALLATAACLTAIVDVRLGRTPDWRRSLRVAVRRLGGLLLVSLLGGAIILLGLLALIVPGVWLAVAFGVAVPALMLERHGPVTALSRSYELVRGRWWPAAGALFAGYLVAALVGALILGLLMIAPSELSDGNRVVGAIALVVGGTIVTALTTPYTAAVIALVYLDLRVRKEGLELRQLGGVDAPPEPEPEAPAPAQPSGWLPPRPPG